VTLDPYTLHEKTSTILVRRAQNFLRALAHCRDLDGPGKINRRQIFTGRSFPGLAADLKAGASERGRQAAVRQHRSARCRASPAAARVVASRSRDRTRHQLRAYQACCGCRAKGTIAAEVPSLRS